MGTVGWLGIQGTHGWATLCEQPLPDVCFQQLKCCCSLRQACYSVSSAPVCRHGIIDQQPTIDMVMASTPCDVVDPQTGEKWSCAKACLAFQGSFSVAQTFGLLPQIAFWSCETTRALLSWGFLSPYFGQWRMWSPWWPSSLWGVRYTILTVELI